MLLSIAGMAAVIFILPGIVTFGGLLLVASLYAFFVGPTSSLVDSAVLTLLGDRLEPYWRIRLWGTLGHGVVAPFAGRLELKWTFWGYALLKLAGLLVITRIPFRQRCSSGSLRGGMRVMFAIQTRMLFLVGFSSPAQATPRLGASKTLMGLALTTSTLSEVPAMFFSDRLLSRFGPRGMLVIAMTAIGLRLLLFSLAARPWVVLLIQLMHGLTFAAIFTAGVYYADLIAPPGMGATTQGMFSVTLYGFGSAAGGMLGGLLLDRFSPGGMYGLIGGLVLAGLIAFLLVERRIVPKALQ
jgi:MFS transporter, PPP family, 3-phenylpropionic acid transporter